MRFRMLPCGAAAFLLVLAVPAAAGVPHTVQPGETLWSIATDNNFTTRTITTFNGLEENASVAVGTTIEIPTEAEGAAALESAGVEAGADDETQGGPPGSPPVADPAGQPGLAPIHHPDSTPYLESEAAAAWTAMREHAVVKLGVDIYPLGPLSAYRTRAQQRYLWHLYKSGEGNPANPPGTSSHETGTAIDLATGEMRKVIDEIGHRYGWQKVEADTEWWHITYVGGYGG